MAQALVESAIANNKIMGKKEERKEKQAEQATEGRPHRLSSVLSQPPLCYSFLQPSIAVFSKSYCPYCVKAKDAIRSALGQPGVAATTVWELDERPSDGAEIQAVLGKITGATTVPRVFVGGKFLGGGDDTARAARDGTLVKLAREAGVAGV